jgi:UTP-glucose-1-phosphate uridylyltransferase
MKPTLLILAAGMGSRFGGLKQISPVGPNGEAIIEYSIFDAIRAGFGKVVFVIRKSFEDEFKAIFNPKLEGKIEVEYVFQELDNLPEGFSLPEGREKPWGTAHAILVAKDVINEPFAAINADDFYGFEAYKAMAGFLVNDTGKNAYSMVGYKLSNTLSDFGYVSRGVCQTNKDDMLYEIIERTQIKKNNSGYEFINQSGEAEALIGDETVSMNFWGFKPSLFDHLNRMFINFLKESIGVPKSEFFIPFAVFDLINGGEASTKVLKADSPWFGVTYKEDQPFVVEKIKAMVESGDYPEKIW